MDKKLTIRELIVANFWSDYKGERTLSAIDKNEQLKNKYDSLSYKEKLCILVEVFDIDKSSRNILIDKFMLYYNEFSATNFKIELANNKSVGVSDLFNLIKDDLYIEDIKDDIYANYQVHTIALVCFLMLMFKGKYISNDFQYEQIKLFNKYLNSFVDTKALFCALIKNYDGAYNNLSAFLIAQIFSLLDTHKFKAYYEEIFNVLHDKDAADKFIRKIKAKKDDSLNTDKKSLHLFSIINDKYHHVLDFAIKDDKKNANAIFLKSLDTLPFKVDNSLFVLDDFDITLDTLDAIIKKDAFYLMEITENKANENLYTNLSNLDLDKILLKCKFVSDAIDDSECYEVTSMYYNYVDYNQKVYNKKVYLLDINKLKLKDVDLISDSVKSIVIVKDDNKTSFFMTNLPLKESSLSHISYAIAHNIEYEAKRKDLQVDYYCEREENEYEYEDAGIYPITNYKDVNDLVFKIASNLKDCYAKKESYQLTYSDVFKNNNKYKKTSISLILKYLSQKNLQTNKKRSAKILEENRYFSKYLKDRNYDLDDFL